MIENEVPRWSIRGNNHKFFDWLMDNIHKKETMEEGLMRLTGYTRELKKAAKQGGGKKT